MFLSGQVGNLDWQPYQNASRVSFSVPPTSATQSANVQLTLNQETFDGFDFHLGDEFHLTFAAVAQDYEPKPGEIVLVMTEHQRVEYQRAVAPAGKENPNPEQETVRTSLLKGHHLAHPANPCKFGNFTISVDTAHVETHHEVGDRFVLGLRNIASLRRIHGREEQGA